MPLSCMWFSRQWKKPSKQLTQPQPALLWLQHLCYRSSHFWLIRWLTHSPATRRVHRLKSSWTNTWRSSSHGGTNGKQFWMDRQAVYHWHWTCCRHQHQKHMLNISSPSVECLQLEELEDEIGWIRTWRFLSCWSWTIISFSWCWQCYNSTFHKFGLSRTRTE